MCATSKRSRPYSAAGRRANQEAEYRRLPARYQQGYIPFYNAIAKGRLRPEDAISRMELIDPREEKSTPVRRKYVSLALGEEFAGKLRQAARYKDTSVTNYVRRRIYADVIADSEAYAARVRATAGGSPGDRKKTRRCPDRYRKTGKALYNITER